MLFIGGADIQLKNLYNKGVKFLLFAIDIYSKYAWVVRLEDKKAIAIIIVFQKFLDKFGRQSDKMWEDHGTELYNRSMKSWLHDGTTEMCLIHNK